MNLFNIDNFNNLSTFSEPNCLSIHIPAHIAGKEVLQKEDKILFKNQLKLAKNTLVEEGLKEAEVKRLLEPAVEFLEDESDAWRNLSHSLSVFLSPNHFSYFTSPITCQASFYLSDHFYLKPILPLVSKDKKFYLLSLSQQHIKLYECTRFSIKEVEIEELVPEGIHDRPGYDNKEKSLQFRSGITSNGDPMFHGQGANSDIKEVEIEKFLRDTDKGLMSMLHDKKSPLVLAAVDYLVPIYKKISDYQHISESFVAGNPENLHPYVLHEKAVAELGPYLNSHKEKQLKQYEAGIKEGKTSDIPSQIIPAAINGQVDTLFITKDNSIFGTYHPETNEVLVNEEKRKNNMSLDNLAAIKTIAQKGSVFLLDEGENPCEQSGMCALFRY